MGGHVQFAIFAFVIGLGYFLKRVGLLSEDDAGPLSRVILNVTLPATVLKSVLGFRLQAHQAALPLAVVAYGLAMFAIALLLRRRVRGDMNLFTISLLGFNMGLFAYPLIESVYGPQALGLAVLADFGNAVIIFGLAYVLSHLSAERARGEGGDSGPVVAVRAAFRLLTFIPFMSFVVALLLARGGYAPGGFESALLDVLSRANLGLVLLLLGVTFSVPASKKDMGFIATVLGIRYAAGAMAGLVVYCAFPGTALERLVLIVTFVLPAGMSIIPYSLEFGMPQRAASAIVNVSNVVSLAVLYAITWVVPPAEVTSSFRF